MGNKRKRYGYMGLGGYIGLSDNITTARRMATVRKEHIIYEINNGCAAVSYYDFDHGKWFYY